MKKIFFLMIMLLFSVNCIYADETEKEYIPSNFGFKGFGYISAGTNTDIGNGGGFGMLYRYNFNKYFGLGIHTNYIATQNSSSNISHMFDTRFLLTFQHETAYNKKGLVPYLDIGLSFNSGIFNITSLGSFKGYGLGFVIGGGLKYNFEKFYVGISIDNNLAFILNKKYSKIDPSSLRINLDTGFRF